jgi:hypothetical protein
MFGWLQRPDILAKATGGEEPGNGSRLAVGSDRQGET